jgi:hypothetical protein
MHICDLFYWNISGVVSRLRAGSLNAKSSALLAEFQQAAKMKGSVTKFMTCSAAILKVSGLFNVRI